MKRELQGLSFEEGEGMAYLELTARQTELHTRALRLSREHRELEAKLCECLREIDETKLFKKLGWPSLFIYATRELGLTEAIAYAFISVARKSREIPELKVAIGDKTLSVAKASRMVSGLNLENAGELIEFAKTRSTRELEAELARRNPESRRRDCVRPVDGDSIELRAFLPKSAKLKLERVTALLAQKGKPTNLASAIESALDEYLKHHDPVEKARRAEARAALNEISVIDHKLAQEQGSAPKANSVVGYEPAQKQGSSRENTRSVRPSRGPNSNLNSSPGRCLKLNSDSNPGLSLSPAPNPNHNLDTNNNYLLRARRVFMETQLAQSDYSPGDDLTKLNSLVARSQNPVSDEKFALNRSRDLSERHTLSGTPLSSQTLSCRLEPHLRAESYQRPLQKHMPSPKQFLGHKPTSLRRPLSASEKHAVFLRDEGRCTFVNERGERCGADRYLHVHHIKMVSHGGTNELSNTTTLCVAHHDLVHQLSLPIEGQINWLRAPATEYVT
jgi:5-methylcytosine-specific restriction endonuclease McrA